MCSAFPLNGLRLGPVGAGRSGWRGWSDRGPAVNSCCQALAQGQAAGSRRRLRRAERVMRTATLISCLRMVAVVALAWKLETRAPAARVRLNAVAARTSQAELAAKLPEGRRWNRHRLHSRAWLGDAAYLLGCRPAQRPTRPWSARRTAAASPPSCTAPSTYSPPEGSMPYASTWLPTSTTSTHGPVRR
jgi:hypothetical protein